MDLRYDAERLSDSPLIERVWRVESQVEGPFISIANPSWSIVLTRMQGRTTITVRGPETTASEAFCPAGAEFLGIEFSPGALMPLLPPGALMNRNDVTLPESTARSFWLNGSAWEFPTFDNVETLIRRLIRDELLIYDPLVESVLRGRATGPSLRTQQRRFLQATGLTRSLVSQIERARLATSLLRQGRSISDTIFETGYFDQPHLSRSLRRFTGLTPAQISDQTRSERLSLLFETERQPA